MIKYSFIRWCAVRLTFEITSEIRKLFKLLKSYKNCFDVKNAKTLFEYKNENHIIDLIFGAKSLYESFYILFKTELDVLKDYLLKNLTLNRIREFSSCANASIFFVFKKNNSFRLCINYRKLNALIIKNKCSFSLIDKTLNRFVSAAYFIKLNFKNAYYWIKIRKNDKWMTTFRTRYNHFKYTIMFFKLVNASVTFQILINKILRELINHICVIYLNDILIYFKTCKKHWKCVRKMLEHLYQFKLYAKLLKYFFMTQIIEFLEYIISNYKVLINSCKMKVLQTWLEFKTLRELQIFLEFANFISVLWDFILRLLMLWRNYLKKINKEDRINHLFLKRLWNKRFDDSLKRLQKRLCWFILISETSSK